MNDRISERALCPFFLTVMRGKKGKLIGVECECLDDHLGFKTTNFTRLNTQQDLIDYTDIFCCDLYQSCPYYIAMAATKYKDS